MKSLQDRCKEMVKIGKSEKEIIKFLHKSGCTIAEAIKFAKEIFDISLGDAKNLVASHPSYADIANASSQLHEELNGK